MKESSKKYFLKDLLDLDLDILELWIEHNAELPPLQWALFVVLLETRVRILKCIKSQGGILEEEHCVPDWLERLSSHDESLSLRDLKIQFEKIKKKVRLLNSELRENHWNEANPI